MQLYNKNVKVSMEEIMSKIKVIHFTIANSGGGITKYILRLWKYIDRSKFQFDFVTMSKTLDFAEELEKEGCKVYYLSTYAEDDREQFELEVRKILKDGRYDVMYLHTSWWRGFVLEEIGKEVGIPKIIVHSHNTNVHIRENQSREAAINLHYQQREFLSEDIATDFLACSAEAADWLYGNKISREKIEIIPYAIELEEYQFNLQVREEYRKKLGIKDEFVIGHVGRFAFQKNHDFLIEVFKEIVKINDNVKLLLIGIGELEDTIKDKVNNLGLKDKVIFTGKREDINCLMQAMDLFAFPSRFEGFGIVLIEAQAAGLKCIVSEEIPPIAFLTENIEALSFDVFLWRDKILKYMAGYPRKNMTEILEDKGFGMNGHVKKIGKILENENYKKYNV